MSEATQGQFQAAKLWERIVWARHNIEPMETDIRVVFEDPHYPDEPCKVLSPSPEWLAMALHGNILPSIEAYLELPLLQVYARKAVMTERLTMGAWSASLKWRMAQQGWEFIGEKVRGDHKLHTSQVMSAMNIPQAIEYLIKKDIPRHVWDKLYNRQMFRICRSDQLPARNEHRNAWRLAT